MENVAGEIKPPQIPQCGPHSRFWLPETRGGGSLTTDIQTHARAQNRCSLGVGSVASAAPEAGVHRRARQGEGTSGQPRRADGRLCEPMSAPGGGISRLVSTRLVRVARAAQAGTAAAPARETRLGLTAAGGSAWGAVSGRRPPSSTMPGIDKLPIEETLEDSPQVRRCGGGYRGKERVGTTPGLGPRWPQVLALTPVGVAAQCSRPSRATPGATKARPPTHGPRGPAPLGRELRAGSGTSAGGDRAAVAFARGPLVVHVRSRGSLLCN